MATFTPQSRSSAFTPTNVNRDSSSMTNISKTLSVSLWDATVQPWQESLPWQFGGGATSSWTPITRN